MVQTLHGITTMLIGTFSSTETHKYYKECDWSKKWTEGLQKILTSPKGLQRLDINDYLFSFFLFGVINVVDCFLCSYNFIRSLVAL